MATVLLNPVHIEVLRLRETRPNSVQSFLDILIPLGTITLGNKLVDTVRIYHMRNRIGHALRNSDKPLDGVVPVQEKAD